MKILLPVLLFILGLNTAALQAQQPGMSTVTGTVTDSASGRPLRGATVTIEDGPRIMHGTITSSRGQFTFESIMPGRWQLRVRYIGHEMQVRPIGAPENRIITENFALVGTLITKSPVEVIGEAPDSYKRLPGTATTIEPRQIALIAPIGTQELLEYVPGVNASGDDGIGNSRISVGIRGLNPRRSSHVLFLEDGVPIQPALYVYPNMYYNPPAERIERLEVIKGSGAIKYGPQTMGGVINYITRRPRQNFGINTALTYGNNGYISALAEIGGWGTDDMHPELQLLYKRGDGFRDNNSFTQYNGTLKLNLIPDASKIIYIKANLNYEESHATYTGLTEYSFATDPRFNPKKHDLFTVQRAALDVLYTDDISEQVTANTKAYANVFDRQWWRENDVFVSAAQYDPNNIVPVPYFQPGDLIRVGNGVDNQGYLRRFNTLGIEQTYDVRHTLFGNEASVQIGGRLHWERFKDDRKVGNAVDARDGVYYRVDQEDTTKIIVLGQSQHYETMALALHASEQLRIGDLTLTPGLRFEVFEQEQIDRLLGSKYSDKTSHVVLPGLGFNYDLGSANIFGGVHRGYTPPSSGTLQSVNFGAEAGSGGLDLESEKSWNSELGFRTALSWIGLELAGYHLAIEDLVAAGRGTVFRNLGRVSAYGIEAGGTLRASNLLSFLPDANFSYTYLQTRIDKGEIKSAVIAGNATVDISGNELPYAPHHTLTAGISRDFDFGLSLRADAHYVGRVYTDFENIEEIGRRGDKGPVPAYTIFNASAAYLINNQWRISVTAKNLTDKIYIASRLHSNPGQPEANLSSGIIAGTRRQLNVTVGYTMGGN